MKLTMIAAALAVSGLLSLAACGGGGGSSPPTTDPPDTPVAEPETEPEPDTEPMLPDEGETGEIQSPPSMPPPAVTPMPSGVLVACGIEVCLVWWDSPWSYYTNHGLTRIYRNTVDDFATATQIGTSTGISHTDDTVRGEQPYFYWVVWEAYDTGTRGTPSIVSEGEPARDPADVIAEISDDILNDPFAQELLEPVSFNEVELPALPEIPETPQTPSRYVPLSERPAQTVLSRNGFDLKASGGGMTFNELRFEGELEENLGGNQEAIAEDYVRVDRWSYWAGQGETELFEIVLDGDVPDGVSVHVSGNPSGSNPVAGSVTWVGAAHGYFARTDVLSPPFMRGSARLVMDLTAATVDVALFDFTAGARDMAWDDLPVVAGRFSDTTIRGAFYGLGHEGVAGAFERDDVRGTFGAIRE